MPRGNWRYILAIGLASLAAFTLALLIYDEASRSEAFYEQQAAEGAQAARDSAAKHVERACITDTTASFLECQSDEYEAARERERNERDLQAQLVTSAWTRAMGMAALIATFVGIVGVGLVYVTFRETRRAAESASKTYEAFVKVERAILKVHSAGISYSSGDISLNVAVTNIGKSACVVVAAATAWQKTNRFDETQTYLGSERHEFIDASEAKSFGWFKRKDRADRFLRGLVRYTSPLDDHVSHFCFEVIETKAEGRTVHVVRENKGDDWPRDT